MSMHGLFRSLSSGRRLEWLRNFLVLAILLVWLGTSTSVSRAATGYNTHLRRYPYLTDTVNSYATINWGTDRLYSSGAVRWGKYGSESCTAHYAPASRYAITVNSAAEYQWKVMLNLLPGTQYCYRVYLGSSASTEIDLLGADASPIFWTQVPSGSNQAYSFVVFGDWGYVDSTGANPYQGKIMSLIANTGARFAITTGDNGYPSGSQTNFGDLVQKGSNISAIFGPTFWKLPGSFMPIFAALGNHGMSNSDPIHPHLLNFPQDRIVAASGGRYIKETYCCLDGTTSASYPSAWYAFDIGLIRFYVLDATWSDSNIGTATDYQVDYDYHWTTTSPEYKWLQADLVAHPSVLKIAIWHSPLYSDNPFENSDAYLQGSTRLEGLLRQYGVDLAFTGHSHTYERNLASPVGFPNYVTGGGGAPSGTLGTCTSLDAYAIKYTTSGKACGSAPVPTSVDQFYHFLLVSVNGFKVTVTPVNSLGQSFDVQTYAFTNGSELNAPSVPAKLAATVVGGTQINLSWAAATDNTGVRGYDIYRNGVLIATTDTSTLTYSDAGLLPSTSYTYTVDAFDGSGNHSAKSSSVLATTSSIGTYAFASIADTYVSSSATSTNYGTASSLKIDGSPDYHGYLRFNVSDISGTVTKATLMLYSTATSSAGYEVHAISSHSWEENLMTYSNAPALGALIKASGPVSADTWVAVDVTSLITGNGLYDFAIRTTGSAAISFNSRDASSSQPQLIVQTLAGSAPAATVTVTSSATPTSTVTVAPPATSTATKTSQAPSSTSTLTSTVAPIFTATNTSTATPTSTAGISTATLTRTPAATPTLASTATVTPASGATATPTTGLHTPVFSDGFEAGNLSAWTSSGGLTVESAVVHNGTYAVQGNTTNGATYAKKTLGATYSNGYARIYFNLISYASQVNLLRYRTAGDVSMTYLFVNAAGQLGLRNDVSATTLTSTTTVGSGWHALEFHVICNGASSATEVWLDGVKVNDLSITMNLGANVIGKVQIGEVNTGKTYNMIIDDVVFDTQQIGL